MLTTADKRAPNPIPTQSQFEPKCVEIPAPSGRAYVLRELTGFEQMQSDAGVETMGEVVAYRVAHAIESIDGEPITPRTTRTALDSLLRSISGRDLDFLMIEYAKAFSPTAQANEIKNEPTPSD